MHLGASHEWKAQMALIGIIRSQCAGKGAAGDETRKVCGDILNNGRESETYSRVVGSHRGTEPCSVIV